MRGREIGLHLIALFVVAVILLLSVPGTIFASDYEPLPGILDPEDVDFGGRTVTIIRGGLPDEERIAAAKELFNVELEALRLEGADQIIARIMAGDSKLDIIRMPHRQGYFTLVSSGYLMPVGDILPPEHYDALSVADRYTIDKLQYMGKYYGFGSHHGLHNGSMMLMAYNKTILEQNNQPDPYELWLAGEWTLDIFEEIAFAVTQDTNGDGVIDQFGMTDIANATAFYRIAPANGVEIVRVEPDGRYVFNYDSVAAIEMLNRVYKWRHELQFTGGNFDQGTAAFTTSHLAGIRHAKANGIDYGLVSYPKGPHADRYYYPVFEFWMMMLPVNAEMPEELMALGCFLYREEDTYADLDFRINEYMNTKEHAELYMAAIESWRGEGDMFQNTELWTICNNPVSDVINGRKGAAAAMDEIRQVAQSFLDDLFGQ